MEWMRRQKAMLYELIVLCLADSDITEIESALLKQFHNFLKISSSSIESLNEKVIAVNRDLD